MASNRQERWKAEARAHELTATLLQQTVGTWEDESSEVLEEVAKLIQYHNKKNGDCLKKAQKPSTPKVAKSKSKPKKTSPFKAVVKTRRKR